MWPGSVIELDDWSEFASELRGALAAIGHDGLVLIRNFMLATCDVDDEMRPTGETDRLAQVLRTGTDRDGKSSMWNAPGHDFEHDLTPSGKTPADIIYAYVAELTETEYRVHYLPEGEPEEWDLTDQLTEFEGVLVYDAAKLDRVAKNEHWFRGDPRDALLAVFKLREEV
ncbi:hypothetical protein [Sphingopyxis sp. EG6]|uniref:hypothetical protein n=1 Tax=Sphingopyxis sp. EG6 TaxID=1874061 RepID=UPI000DC626B5|nr:hypothetical protein [Sphingopyxis sp. EG6]BBB10710.1 hypothetical protein SPYCW_3726 [Sphingopyxis sp. EG6]